MAEGRVASSRLSVASKLLGLSSKPRNSLCEMEGPKICLIFSAAHVVQLLVTRQPVNCPMQFIALFCSPWRRP